MDAYIGLIILIGCVILFITRVIPSAVTACVGCLAFAITGICTMEEAFSGFSDSIVILVFGVMVVGIAMLDTGLANIVGKWVTKFSYNNERLFILIASLVGGILSTFLSNTAVIAIFLPVIDGVVKSDQKINRLRVTLPICMGAMFGGVCTLVGSTPQLTANGILDKMVGMQIGMFDYTLPGVIVFLMYLLFVETVGYSLSKKLWSNRIIETNNLVNNNDDKVKLNSYDNKKIFIMLGIFIMMVISFIGGWVSIDTTAAIAAILCVITKCTSVKNIFKNIEWTVIFVLAGCLGIAAGLNSSGFGKLVGDAMTNILDKGIPIIVIFAFFVITTMIISNFITNSTAVVIVLPIALSICVSQNYNVIPFTIGIVLAANLTFATPLANAQTAMTLVAGYKFSDYFKYGIIMEIIIIVSILIFVPLIYPFV